MTLYRAKFRSILSHLGQGQGGFIPKTLLLLAFMAVALMGLAPEPLWALNQDKILNGLAKRYSQFNSIVAEYRRVATTPSTDQIFKTGSSQVATGTLSWARPAKLKLDQQKPQEELMVTDGSIVWWYIPSEKLVYRYQNIDVAGQLKPLISFLGGLDSLKTDFEVSLAPPDADRPGQHGLVLLPRGGPEEGVDRFSVWCDAKFMLTGFEITSVTGETTDFYLEKIQENPAVDSKTFNFKIPPGTEVMEE